MKKRSLEGASIMKIAYFDCFSGAAGDMIAGAMLDAGLDFEFLKSQIATLGLKNLDITVSETRRAGLRAKHFVPLIKEEHHHRHLGDIKKIINNSKIGEKPKQTAIAIFGRLAQAEAAVHGKDPDDIHFHEVGAMDSIVDIVSAAVGFDALGIEKIYCSALAVGGGQVKAAHGIMPVPAPATAELLKGIPTVGGPIDKELLTPTGAAILTTVAESFGPIPPMTIEATGYGAGTLDSEHVPNVVRLILGRSAEESSATTDRVCLIETNIDDSTGEIIANAMDKLLSAGALDVFATPIIMKQTRPAVKLTVICQIADIAKMEEIIFQSGITFGLRRQIVERSKLAREFVTVATRFGNIKIKVGKWADRVVNAKPEFADCAKAAQEHNASVKEVMQAAIAEFKKTR
jgi:pyridinium-3,5-bisthiocarboxylic acid mononucleotide nickel chelatase